MSPPTPGFASPGCSEVARPLLSEQGGTERLLRRTGDSVYLSPEGERVTTGRLGRFNEDNFHLAANLGAPIVPFYIDIPREIDPGKGFDTLPGTVHVHVQPAISTRGWTLENLASNTEMVRDIFVKIQKELRGGGPGGGPAVPPSELYPRATVKAT